MKLTLLRLRRPRSTRADIAQVGCSQPDMRPCEKPVQTSRKYSKSIPDSGRRRFEHHRKANKNGRKSRSACRGWRNCLSSGQGPAAPSRQAEWPSDIREPSATNKDVIFTRMDGNERPERMFRRNRRDQERREIK